MVEADWRLGAMNLATKLGTAPDDGWNANGWALVSGFLDADEVAELRQEADRLCKNEALFQARGAVPNSVTRSDRLDPVIDVSPPFAALARDRRLLALVSGILGGEAQLFKDKFIAKPPGAAGYATHQDAAYWPGLGLDLDRFLTAAIFLDESTAEKGAIECAGGHHLQLLTDPDKVADPDESGLGQFTTVEAKTGDLILIHALTPHRSGPNRSSDTRRALLFTYGIDPRPDLYDLYKQLQLRIRS
jgi:ectoine hydroxylase-related dioxygenase (phytanoyl-CoA dioxygenase family)